MNIKFLVNQCILTLAIVGISFFSHAEDALKISTNGGLNIVTADGNASFVLGGRLQWDYDKTEVDGVAGGDRETFAVRRARLFAQGKIGEWGYKAQFNLGEGEGGSAEDLFITYNGFGKGAKLTIGRLKEPFSLDDQASSKDMSLLERAAVTEAYVPGRNAGVQLSGKTSNLFYALGIYRDEEEDAEGAAEKAITGRVAYAPINEQGKVLHLGAAYRAGDRDDVYVAELAGVLGQWHIQMEHYGADKAGTSGTYAQVGYVISGTPRPYSGGVFKRVKPRDGVGVEVAARIESGEGKYSDIGLGSGDGEQIALGINLYPNNNVRFGLSYMAGELDNAGNDGSEFRFRIQIAF